MKQNECVVGGLTANYLPDLAERLSLPEVIHAIINDYMEHPTFKDQINK